ncbi:MAG TPA: hypothetical protein PLZ08_10225 [Bacillota bacterium]|nr:hypothetical protein [Bacillota bacterium]HOL10570.1 hypothetical protein [Bacillota bacterium]HPO98314.1 hypothetical protein [Bacillota bacterium]
MLLLLLNCNPVRADVSEVNIESSGDVEYDIINNTVIANDEVILISDNVRIEAATLKYNVDSGWVVANGGVKITFNGNLYYSEELEYNINEQIGSTAAFTATIKEQPRDLKIRGERLIVEEDSQAVDQARLTSCPEIKPHYEFSAKKITITAETIILNKTVLRVKGIPVFYYPQITLPKKNGNDSVALNSPALKPGYSKEDGLTFDYQFETNLLSNSKLVWSGNLKTKTSSKVGLGLKIDTNNISNLLKVAYDFDDYWEIADYFYYNTERYFLVVDGVKDFSPKQHNETGFSITRKYWNSSLGRWQLGFLARQTWSDDENKLRYGGIYSGIRLDYNPHPYVTISYLGIHSFTNKEYHDLMSDFGLGTNILYDIKLPINQEYQFGLEGTYNIDDGWYSQKYMIVRDSCCFKTTITYDVENNDWDLKLSIKF